MDELVKELQKKYIEDLTSSFELHKIFIFVTFLVSFLKLIGNKTGSIWLELINSRVKDILDTTNGPFSKTTILYVTICILLTYFSGLIYKSFKIRVFNFFASKRNFDDYVRALVNKSDSEVTESQSLNLYLADDQKIRIEIRRKSLLKIHSMSEILFSFLVVSIAGIFRLNYVDFGFGIFFCILIFYLQKKSCEYYISKIVPLLVIESLLRKKDFRFTEGFEEKIQP
jgi:hypothetical protein